MNQRPKTQANPARRHDGDRDRGEPRIRPCHRDRIVGSRRRGGRCSAHPPLLEQVRSELGDTFTPVVADAADPATASRLVDEYGRAHWCCAPGPRRG